jgi:hypothetical protein
MLVRAQCLFDYGHIRARYIDVVKGPEIVHVGKPTKRKAKERWG